MLRTPERSVLRVAAVMVACLAAGLSGLLVPAAAGAAPHPAQARITAVMARGVLSRIAARAGAPGAAAGAGAVARAAELASLRARLGGNGTGDAAGNRFCRGLGRRYLASSGAYMFCRGPQRHGPAGQVAHAPAAGHPVPGVPASADAASFAEDVTANGTRGYGQSEVSIAASGPYVVEAWNDATSFFAACPSAKAQGTGFGFSRDGGKSFTDLQGLPDARCAKDIYFGDPSVVAYRAGGHTYFYISSLFDSLQGLGKSFVALSACRVAGSGGRASLRCGQPVIAGASSQCQTSGSSSFCSFLDKDFLTIDPARGRLYDAFSEFKFDPVSSIVTSTIEAGVCDLGTPAGRLGPAGGTPAAPACEHGTPLRKAGQGMLAGKPYLTIQRPDPAGCEYEGAYPAADTASGSLYVGFEHNWGTSLSFFGPTQCLNRPIRNVVTKVPWRCLVLRAVSPCAGPAARVSVRVTSISGGFVPGFFPSSLPSDFPRLAVSDPAHTVSMVWNDTRHHLDGDILLQSFTLRSLRPVQARPVVLDTPHHGGLTFMPAVRTATAGGLLDVSWYSRNSVTTFGTTVKAALGVSPRATRTPAANITITTVASDWGHQIFDIEPNFGDYTDNALTVTGHRPYVGGTLYVAWTDGRLGVPQPFEAHLPAGG